MSAIELFLWDCYIWCKVRLFPDKRPSSELFAEVKERLSNMPASKQIHEAYELIEKAEPGAEQKGTE